MKFSVNWLKEWAEVGVDADELADRLTDGGLEVNTIKPAAAPFTGVVVGEITACDPHPDADKLTLCQVDTGDGDPLPVVCGAPNARAGLKIPFARIGAELDGPDGKPFKIKKTRLRGVESHGMACSARELGLSDDHSGLLELPVDAPLGEDFRNFLGLDDHVIDLELTPNRADCLGIKGLARDVAAILGSVYTPPEHVPLPPAIDDAMPVELVDAEHCPRFGARVIRGIDPAAQSPLWLREVLRRSGIRSISLVVDLTNYVMMELGQPMHAYDLDRLQGGITVRMGRLGEKVVLLDEKEVELDERLLAICDESGPVGLGGIMGGLGTGVTGETTNVLLEAAWFLPATIMGRARDLGMHTDASHRFERGVDPTGQGAAIERLSSLLIDIAGGKAGPTIVTEVDGIAPQPQAVKLRLARLNRVLGSDLEAGEVERILASLGMSVSASDGGWEATAPPSRFDIAIEEDLIEEVARIHGYNRLPSALPSGELSLQTISESQVALTQVREALCAAGYQEAINYSFVDRRLLTTLGMDQDVLPLANPISSDMDVMRTALLPGLLTSMERNLRHQQDRVRLFETGVVFHQQDSLAEIERVGAVACGMALPQQWGAKPEGADHQPVVDFYDLKGDIEALLELRGQDGSIVFEAAAFEWLHPGQSAAVQIDGEMAGWAGAVHPGILAQLDIRPQVYAFELDLEILAKREVPNAKQISQYPSVRRDFAFLVPENVKYILIKDLIDKVAGELLVESRIFDVFSGKSVEKGYKSLAIGLILQDVSCTLTDEVVDSVVDDLIAQMESQLDAQLRG